MFLNYMGQTNSIGVLDILDKYFENNPNNDGDFRSIEDILKSKEFKNHKFDVNDVINAVYCDLDLKFSVRGNRIRPKPAELNCEPSVILSKKMAALLRHGLSKCSLKVIDGSFIKLSDMLRLKAFKGFTEEDVLVVVNTNDKRRYEIVDHKSGSIIRALQGHSVEVADIGLTAITNVEDLPIVFHGTFYSNWDKIQQKGLLKMGRNHIHLSKSNSPKHLRDGSQLIIEIDSKKAIEDGIRFYESKNNVILCDGDNGVLKLDYFIKAWDITTDKLLYGNGLILSQENIL